MGGSLCIFQRQKYDDMVKGKKKSVGKTSNKFENVENKNNNILNNDNMESTNNINSEQDYSDMDPFSSDENIKRNKEEINIDKYNKIENYDYFDNFEKLKNHNKTNINIYRRCISTPNLTRKKTMVIKKNKSFPCSHISYDYHNNTLKGTDFTYTHELHSGPKYVIDSTVSEKSFLETSQIVSNSCTNQSMGSFKFDECNGYSSSSFKFNQSNEDDGTKSIRLVLENETNNKEIKEYNKIIKTSHSLYCLNDNFNKTKKFKIKKSNSTYFNDKNISLCF